MKLVVSKTSCPMTHVFKLKETSACLAQIPDPCHGVSSTSSDGMQFVRVESHGKAYIFMSSKAVAVFLTISLVEDVKLFVLCIRNLVEVVWIMSNAS